MKETLMSQFPEWSNRIETYVRQDVSFAEMCADYDELTRWFKNHDHEDCSRDSACAANRQLLAELKIEILQYLQAVDRQIDRQTGMMTSRR